MQTTTESQTASEVDTLRARVIHATKALAVYRTLAAALSAALKTKHDAFLADNQFLVAEVAEARKMVEESEATLKTMGVSLYELDSSSKKPSPGIGIQDTITKTVRYDEAKVLPWCQERKGMFLVLDKKSFETYALKGVDLPESTTVVESRNLKATIASDLGKALAELEVAGGNSN